MKSLLRLYPEIDGVLAANDPMAIGAAEALRAANRKALVVGINASREVIEFVKSGDVLGSGDYNGFDQGCLATEIAIRSLRKQPTPKEIILKGIVMDKTNYQDYETPMEQRGNVVILEGPETLLTSVARVKAYKDALTEFPAVKLLASKSANYGRASAAQEMKSLCGFTRKSTGAGRQ